MISAWSRAIVGVAAVLIMSGCEPAPSREYLILSVEPRTNFWGTTFYTMARRDDGATCSGKTKRRPPALVGEVWVSSFSLVWQCSRGER